MKSLEGEGRGEFREKKKKEKVLKALGNRVLDVSSFNHSLSNYIYIRIVNIMLI